MFSEEDWRFGERIAEKQHQARAAPWHDDGHRVETQGRICLSPNFGCETRLHVPSVYMDNSKDGSLRDRTSCYHGRGEIYSRSYLRHALETETEWGPFMQLKRRGSLI